MKTAFAILRAFVARWYVRKHIMGTHALGSRARSWTGWSEVSVSPIENMKQEVTPTVTAAYLLPRCLLFFTCFPHHMVCDNV